jgi:hypothetical protein
MFITVIKFIELRYFNAFIKSQPENVPRTPYSAFIAFATSLRSLNPFTYFFKEGKDKQKYMIGYYTMYFLIFFRPFDFYF